MKRSLSVIMALIMILSLVQVGMVSVSADVSGDYIYTVADGKATVTGYTGTDVNVEIPDTLGGYTVTAIGASAFQGKSAIGSVRLTANIISIGNYAFASCTGMTKIGLDVVKTIGISAFSGCVNLSDTNLNETTLVSIGNYAFYNCAKLNIDTIADTVTALGQSVFQNCTSLQRVFIGTGVTVIDMSAFQGCSALREVNLNGSVTEIRTSAFYYCSALEICAIPVTVTTIGTGAFEGCSSLPSVTIPDSVTSVGQAAFRGCTSLVSAEIGTGLTAISNYTFQSCTGLTDLAIGSNVQSIGFDAFGSCTALASVTIPASVNIINQNCFTGCTGLTQILVEAANVVYSSRNGVLYNDEQTVLFTYPCGKTGTYDVPAGVTEIGNMAFFYCAGLSGVTIPGSVTTIGVSTFSNCDALTSVTIPGNVTSIGNSAFYDCDGLTAISIPDSVTSLGTMVFYRCGNLVSAVIGDGVVSLGTSLFAECGNLESVNIGDSVATIQNEAFKYCTKLTSVVIPAGVTLIRFSAFENCTLLAGAHFRGTAPTMESNVFRLCASGFKVYYLYGKAGFTDPWYGYDTEIDTGDYTYTVASDKAMITDYTGSGGDLMIPPSFGGYPLAAIGANAFSGCVGLTSVTIPEGVIYIGEYAFSNCFALASVTLPDSMVSIDNYAFDRCTSLDTVDIPENVSMIGDYVFNKCTGLTAINVDVFNTNYSSPGGVLFNETQTRLIQYPAGKTGAYIIPDGVTIIDYGAFRCSAGLTDITIPDSVVFIRYWAFSECNALTSVSIPGGVYIWGSAFWRCTGLSSVEIGSGGHAIGLGAFQYCTSLESLTIGTGLTEIQDAAFKGCSALGAVLFLGNAPDTVGTAVFDGCAGGFTVYYLSDESGFSDPWNGYPAALFAPSLSASPEILTNGDVTVTIDYPDMAASREVKTGEGAWIDYTSPVVLTDNSTVYARCADSFGNYSATESAVVTNIDKIKPAKPVLSPSTAAPTNGNVTVTITYPTDAYVKEYGFNNLTWQPYTAPFEVTENGTVYARCYDEAGNRSDIGVIIVDCIDKQAPDEPTFEVMPAEPTNGNVTVTVICPADAVIKEYNIGGGVWTAYTAPLVMTENGTVNARCFDAAGNASATGSVVIATIDREPPATPSLFASPTAPTNAGVTVTITYPADAAVKEYRVDTGAWTPYTEPLFLTDNATVYARCYDAAGNVSGTNSLTVTNIDKIKPAKPVLTPSTAAPTNCNVTVTITYPTDAYVKEYGFNNLTWQPYTAPFEVTENGTVYARCYDEAGNRSDIGVIIVDCIDRQPPDEPAFEALPFGPTAGNVTVSITYPADAAVNEYNIGGGAWTAYTVPLVITDNGTVNARCFDTAGNVSATGSIIIDNIDRDAPAAPSLFASPLRLQM